MQQSIDCWKLSKRSPSLLRHLRRPRPLLKKLHGCLICASPFAQKIKIVCHISCRDRYWKCHNRYWKPAVIGTDFGSFFREGSLVCPSLFLNLSCLWVKISRRLTIFMAHNTFGAPPELLKSCWTVFCESVTEKQLLLYLRRERSKQRPLSGFNQ